MKLPCCQSVGTDALLLCQRMGPGSAASPELATGCRNTWNRQRKGGRRAVDVVWSLCVLLPIALRFSFAFFCLCGSIWLVWNGKPPAAFSGQESPFVLRFLHNTKHSLGPDSSRTQKSLGYQSVLPLKFIAKFIPLSLAVKWCEHWCHEPIFRVKEENKSQKESITQNRFLRNYSPCKGLGVGRCMPAVSGRVTLVTSGCESWGAVPAPLE